MGVGDEAVAWQLAPMTATSQREGIEGSDIVAGL